MAGWVGMEDDIGWVGLLLYGIFDWGRFIAVD